MILAIGHDMVEIERFAQWHTYSPVKLQKIFHQTEIEYCLHIPAYSAQRFAVRFAAKEAAYKALCSGYLINPLAFLTVAKSVCVVMDGGKPQLYVDPSLQIHQPTTWHVSLTHSKSLASAVVIAELSDT